MKTDIDEVSIEINSNSQQAATGLNTLKQSISKLYSSLDVTLSKMSKFNNELNNLKKNLSQKMSINIDTSAIDKVKEKIKGIENASGKTSGTEGTKEVSNNLDVATKKANIFDSVMKRVKNTLAQIAPAISKAISIIPTISSTISSTMSKAIGNINNKIKTIEDAFSRVKNKVSEIFKGVNFNKKLGGAEATKGLSDGLENTGKQASVLGNIIGKVKETIAQIAPNISKVVPILSKVTSSIGKAIDGVANKVKKIKDAFIKVKDKMLGFFKGSNIDGGIKKLAKYAMALFSIRGTYALLNSAANRWLSSSNIAAKQLSANMEYLKFAAGSSLAPIIEYLVNLIYRLLKAIQTVVYYLTGMNIFAKAFASDMKSAAGSAKEAAKALAPFDELNVIDFGSASGGGAGEVAPSIDLTKVDTNLSGLSEKLYNFFKPLKDSWDVYGGELVAQLKTTASQVGGLIASVWGSFENIITNGTIYKSLELILQIIGNIAEAFANAWNYNGNGDAIIQNLANAFNNLLIAINNVVKSKGFQDFLNWMTTKFKEISEKIASINWQPLVNELAKIGGAIGQLALTVLSGLVDVLKWFIEHPQVAEIIFGIYLAFQAFSTLGTVIDIINEIETVFEFLSVSGLGTTLLGIVAVIGGAVMAISNFFSMLQEGFSWVKEVFMVLGIAIAAVGAVILGIPAGVAAVVAAIVAVIATIVVVIKDNWNAIADFLSSIANWIYDNVIAPVLSVVTPIVEKVNEIISTIWQIIVAVFSVVANWINNIVIKPVLNFFSKLWNGIIEGVKNIWNTIVSVFKPIADWIYNNVVKPVSDFFSAAFTFIGDAVSGIIKGAINGVLSTVENIINFFINGINNVVDIINAIPRSKYIKNNITIITKI